MRDLRQTTLAFTIFFLTQTVHAQFAIDARWTFRAGAQFIRADENGTISIPNVGAHDVPALVGAANIGNANYVAIDPILSSDDGRTYTIESLTIAPAPMERITDLLLRIEPDQPSTLQPGEQRQLQPTAVLDNGNAATPTDNIVYHISDDEVVSITDHGLATAIAPGTAIITAVCEGHVSTLRLDVDVAKRMTTVEGLVTDGSGAPIVDATVTDQAGNTATTNEAGYFNLTTTPEAEDVRLVANAPGSGGAADERASASTRVRIAHAGTIDAGILILEAGFPNANGGFETGDFSGFTVTGNARIVETFADLVPPQGNFMAYFTTGKGATDSRIGTLDAGDIDLPPHATTLAFDLNYMTNEPEWSEDDLRLTIYAGENVLRTITIPDTFNPTPPAIAHYDRQTGFREASIDLADLAGQRVRFVFTIADTGDPGVESGALIDALRVIPRKTD